MSVSDELAVIAQLRRRLAEVEAEEKRAFDLLRDTEDDGPAGWKQLTRAWVARRNALLRGADTG